MVVEHYMTVDAQHLFDTQHYKGATQGGEGYKQQAASPFSLDCMHHQPTVQ